MQTRGSQGVGMSASSEAELVKRGFALLKAGRKRAILGARHMSLQPQVSAGGHYLLEFTHSHTQPSVVRNCNAT